MYVFSMQCINEMDTWKLEEFPNAFTVSNRRKIYMMLFVFDREHIDENKKRMLVDMKNYCCLLE